MALKSTIIELTLKIVYNPVLKVQCGSRQLVAFYCLGFRPLLDSAASRTAVLQCGTVCHQPCAKTCQWLHLRHNWQRTFSDVHIFFSQWLSKTTRRCCSGFAISAPWY